MAFYRKNKNKYHPFSLFFTFLCRKSWWLIFSNGWKGGRREFCHTHINMRGLHCNCRYSSFVCQHTYFSLVGLFSKHHNSFSLHDILNIHWTVEQRLHANYGGSATTFNKNEVSLSHDREYLNLKYFSGIQKRGPIYTIGPKEA